MPKILFIQPTQYSKNGGLCKQKKMYLPGLVFPLLAAMTPSHWTVEVKLEVVDEIDFESDADIIGIGTMGHATFRGIEIATEFRKRGKLVMMGGYMASIVPDEALKYVDSVMIGDGEISYPLMLKDFETTGKIKSIYNNPVEKLEGLPIPKYEILLEKPIANMLPVQAGRGCPFTCSFCSIACIYKGRYLIRPIEEVIRDIKRVKELGFNTFYLIDDNIVSNIKYMEQLCNEIAPLKMHWASQCALHLGKNPELLDMVRKSGATMMSFGIESITQEGLDKLGKSWLKVSDHENLIKTIANKGILVSSEMILGTDSDTIESIHETYYFIERTAIPIPRFYILTPMPGTELYDQYKAEGRLITEDLNKFDGCSAVHKPLLLEPEKLTELYWWLNNKIYSWGSIFRRTLFNRYFFKRPAIYIFAFFINLHYRKYIKKGVPPNIF